MKDLKPYSSSSGWLPAVHLEVFSNIRGVTGPFAEARGEDPVSWSIYSDRVSDDSARVCVLAAVQDNDKKAILADITVHKNGNENLADEVQEISAAILWSALRAWRMRQEQE